VKLIPSVVELGKMGGETVLVVQGKTEEVFELSDSRICCISVESSLEGFPGFGSTFGSNDRG
jgi:hypothetical protein